MAIESERLMYRPYRDEDFEFLFSMLADPETMRYIGNGRVRDREGALQFMYWIYHAYDEDPDHGLMLLIRKEDGERIGHAGLVAQTIDGVEELEIGYWIARKHWGHGYAKEAAQAFLDYGTQTLGKNKFISLIQPKNTASRKVAESIGMKLEKKVFLSGQEVDVYTVNKSDTSN